MIKIFSAAFIGISLFSAAQKVTIMPKVNLLFNTNSGKWSNVVSTVSTAYSDSGKNSVGFNAGVSAKVDLGAFFVMPELYYTSFKNEYNDPITNTAIEAKSNRLDLPVLLGRNILLKKIGIFVGPVASYNLIKNEEWDEFKTHVKNQFTVGYQYGAQVSLRKLIVGIRYEGAFSKDERKFINLTTNQTIRYDCRPNLVLIGIGIRL